MVWGLAVTLAVYLTRNICCAHLNPAVSVAMVVAGRMKAKMLPGYLVAQVLGAILAGWKDAALPDAVGGWFWVYILAPIVGSSIAALFFKYVLEPINIKKNKECQK